MWMLLCTPFIRLFTIVLCCSSIHSTISHTFLRAWIYDIAAEFRSSVCSSNVPSVFDWVHWFVLNILLRLGGRESLNPEKNTVCFGANPNPRADMGIYFKQANEACFHIFVHFFKSKTLISMQKQAYLSLDWRSIVAIRGRGRKVRNYSTRTRHISACAALVEVFLERFGWDFNKLCDIGPTRFYTTIPHVKQVSSTCTVHFHSV